MANDTIECKEQRADVARKIMEGYLITEEEFEVAKAAEMYGPDTRYEVLHASYYREPKGRFGYICLKHENPTDDMGTAKIDGQEVPWRCGFGLHIPDLLWRHLTFENIGLLVSRFGKDIVDRIPKHRSRKED